MISKDLVAASATPIVLSILAKEESYGYAIIQRVRELSGGRMQWADGMLYPVLHRLERQKLIRSRWEVAENRRKRKLYQITKRGQWALADSQAQWQVVQTTLGKLWGDEPCLT
jgi:PadR family transcriptional regulator, regulatory protein PadR